MGRQNQHRYNIQQAAEHLGLSSEAVRMRVKRGTLASKKGEDGRTYVCLDDKLTQNERQTQHTDLGSSDELVEALRSQVDDLREQLRAEREANRENRRLLAAALERIPELEAPQEQPPYTETQQEAQDKPSEPPQTGEGVGTRPGLGKRLRRWWRG